MRWAICGAVALALGGCGALPGTGSGPGDGGVGPIAYRLSMGNYRYTPSDVAISQGATVLWINGDTVPHTVTSGPPDAPDGTFDTVVPPGGSFSYTFARPGSYPFYCRYHYAMGMIGSVTVGAPPTASVPAPASP